MSLQLGELLQGRYHIVRSIKKGGMGAVYEARDVKLADSPCAVKEILDSARIGQDSQYIQGRFFQEMKALSALDHPSIPKVRDYLTVNSVIYIVMDLVQGASLEDEVEEIMGLTGAPPVAEKSVRDMLQLLETVAYLHAQQPAIIHRDIKPANILRDQKTGSIKLVDFGLARQMDSSSSQTVVGTLGYCSPEQMMGKSGKESDLYSVGITLNQLLTGHRPESINFEPLRPALPGIRPGLAEIVEKSTQLNPGDRYTSAQEMANDLQAWLNGQPARKTTADIVSTAARSSWAWARIPAAVLALGAAMVVGDVMGHSPTPTGPAKATFAPKASPARFASLPPTTTHSKTPAPRTQTVIQYVEAPPRIVYVSRPAVAKQPAPIVPQLGAAPAYPTYTGPPIMAHPQATPTPETPAPPWDQPPPVQNALAQREPRPEFRTRWKASHPNQSWNRRNQHTPW